MLNFSLNSSAKCGTGLQSSLWSVFRRDLRGIRLAFDESDLSCCSGWGKYRVGHYGAVTKVLRGNLAGKDSIHASTPGSRHYPAGRCYQLMHASQPFSAAG